MNQYVLVRHSAYTTAADPAYEDKVEPAAVDRIKAYAVRAAGGTLYASRAEAEAACVGARGYFASLRVGGAELFIRQE